MCAWRYKAGGAGGTSGAFSLSGNANTHATDGIDPGALGAGAFLRQNAMGGGASAGGGARPPSSLFTPSAALFGDHGMQGRGGGGGAVERDDEYYDDEEDEEFEEDQHYENHTNGGHANAQVPPLALPTHSPPPPQQPLHHTNGNASFGQQQQQQQQQPMRSLAGALFRNAAQKQGNSAMGQAAGAHSGGDGGGMAAALRKASVATLSRQLFRDTGARAQGNGYDGMADEDDDLEDEEFDELLPDDQEFVLNTRDLFDDVDPELLSPDFVPHEHVVGVIVSDAGDEATAAEIDDNLAQYDDLMEEIDMYLGSYIETHHDEFNKAIADFSQMILAVSGSDDTLARLKKELVLGATSLDTHAEQLRVLRLRAAKTLFMKETLQRIQDALTAEAEVKQLLKTKHYLRAVQQLQKHSVTLQDESMKQVRATSGLRDFVESTKGSVHTYIIDDLLTCVFRQEKLVRADAQLLYVMMADTEGDGGGAGSAGAAATNLSAPNVRNMVQKYWRRSGGGGGIHRAGGATVAAAATGTAGSDGGEGAGKQNSEGNDADAMRKGKKPHQHTLAAIVETFFDDPTDDTVSSDYLKFIPLCVKSLMLLGKLDNLHEAFFSRTTRNIERFIAHFLRLYDAWRRKIISGTTLGGGDGEATVRATKIRAYDLTNDLVSTEEAIATVQARELRAMLSALFAELEKTVRNADYLVKIIVVARYPFVSEFLVQPTPFDAEGTSHEWDLQAVPLGERVATVEDIVRTAEGRVEEAIKNRLARREAASEETETEAEMPSESGGSSSIRAISRTGYDVWDQVREFFSFQKMMASFTASTGSGDDGSGAGTAEVGLSAKGGVSKTALTTPRGDSPNVAFTLHDMLEFVDNAIASTRSKYGKPTADGVGGYGYQEETHLRDIKQTLVAALQDGLRVVLLREVKELLQQWDLQVLWTQLNYHVEFVFHVLCDAKEAEDEGDDLVTLAPFLRQKNLVSRVQRTAAILKEAENRANSEPPTLDKLLSSYQSSTGLLNMMEEVGTISFSLAGAVKKAQADVRKGNEGQARQYRAMQSETAKLLALSDLNRSGGGGGGDQAGADMATMSGGVGGANAPLVLLHASTLRSWFVFTSMNVVTCYQSAERFCERCRDRVPEFRLLDYDDSVIGFFKRFMRATYIPTLHAFHSQQLQQLCQSMGGTAELAAANIAAAGDTAAASPADGASADTSAVPKDGAASSSTGDQATSVWPTVTVGGAAFPVLTCVHYVGQVMDKISSIRTVLPSSLTEAIERSTSEALVEELSVFLKRKLQLLGKGSIPYRLMNNEFEDAFAAMPSSNWQSMCDEDNMWSAHRRIDKDLYRYYQLNSAQRTSGHEYSRRDPEAMDVAEAIGTAAETGMDEQVGHIPPQELCITDDSSLVALAVLSYSSEWLCEVLLRSLWPGARRYSDYMDSCVPGYLFTKQMAIADSTDFPVRNDDATARQMIRLSGHLTRLCVLAQASLFYLSIQSRFLAFCFIPQLRDESYNIIATSSSADTFVQAYSRRISKFYMLLRQHLSPKKIKYTCLTSGKPASELVLIEMAHLRDKAISEAGLAKLHTDLHMMQTALQLILPTDLDVRGAVRRYFSRPAIFVRYVPNRDVVNELLSSGDYNRFTVGECEELIRLVFRQVTGANDDSLARENITLFHHKLRAINALRGGGGGAGEGDETESSSGSTPSGSDRDEDEEGEGSEHSSARSSRLTGIAPSSPLGVPPRAGQPQQPPTAQQRPPAPAPARPPVAPSVPSPVEQPPPLPLSQPTAVPGRGTTELPPVHSDEDEESAEYEYEDEEEEEEEEEGEISTHHAGPVAATRAPVAGLTPLGAAPTAEPSLPPQVPSLPLPITVPQAAAPAAATAVAGAVEESSDEYYYEEVTDDGDEEYEEETEEEGDQPAAHHRR